MGESNKDGAYDFGWIMNVDTREKVWRFSYSGSEFAGGAKKNRVVDDVFEAPAGRYVLVYTTDDSHSWERWNAAPPHDPSFWGVTLRAEEPGGKKYAKLFDYEEEAWKNVVVDLTRVGDDEMVKKGFTLKKAMDLRVYALGEGMDGRMYDYGWIEEKGTGKVVWEMTYRKTEHAGGARKNRMFSDTIKLEPGVYTVYYETDGSHSYRDWNASRPYEPENWGISVRVVPNR